MVFLCKSRSAERQEGEGSPIFPVRSRGRLGTLRPGRLILRARGICVEADDVLPFALALARHPSITWRRGPRARIS